MSDDARFEEGGEAPLTLVALDPEDLTSCPRWCRTRSSR